MKVTYTDANREKYSDILKDAVENITNFSAYWSENIDKGEEYARFVDHQQWSDIEISDYDNILRKPRLTMNKLQPYVMQLIGEQRQNRPGMETIPDNWEVPQDQIDFVQNIVKNICESSNAEMVFDCAFENQLKRGYGGLRVKTEYENPASFNQVIKLEAIAHPSQMFFDPAAKKQFKEDGDFIGYYDIISKKDFERKYPDAEPVNFNISPAYFPWTTESSVIIAEYYVKEKTKERIALMRDGSVMLEKDAKNISPNDIIRVRDTEDYVIKCYKLTQNEILEEYEWPGRYFPIIYVDGYSYWIDGEPKVNPYIRHAIDAQRFLNYAISEEAYILKKSHGNKWLMTPSNLDGLSEKNKNRWNNPEVSSTLIANPDPITQRMPEQIPPVQVPGALMQIDARADQNIESILGRYGTVIGKPTPDRSGVAIANAAMQSNLGAFIYRDNNNKAIEQAGRVILDLLPHIYDSERNMFMKGKNNQAGNMLVINQQMPDGSIKNDINIAKQLDIRIVAGSSFAMQKQENIDTIMQLLKLVPQAAPLTADLIAENLDLENMPQIVNRIRNNVVPPQVLATEEGRQLPPSPPDPQAQAQMAQAQATIAKSKATMAQAQTDMMQAQQQMQQFQNGGAKDTGLQQAIVKANAEVSNSKIEQQTELMKIFHDNEKQQLQQENNMFRKIMGIMQQ